MRLILKVIIIVIPWTLKRRLLIKFFGYDLHKNSKIGLSYVYPEKLVMNEGAEIGHFNVAVNLEAIIMGKHSSIVRGNWITGFKKGTDSKHFKHQEKDREPVLKIGNHSAITKKHHLDCTHKISIGNYVTIAGYNSQFLTHSIDVYSNRQDSKPILIGDYTFIGTNVVVLGGTKLPKCSVLGAKSLLNTSYSEEWFLYAGVPAKPIKEISKESKYFTRANGFVI